jgi:serine/threonine protein kinase/DNA-directed RNA polymerase specialized sigma24 family protein
MPAAPETAGEGSAGAEVSDAALVAMYRASGSDVALGELIRRHQISVFRLLLSLLGDADEAERACEQAFFDAARKLNELSDPAGFPAWIAGIARGIARKAEAAKGKKPKKPAAPRKPATDPRGVVKQQVQGVLGELTNDERAALVLADLQGDSYESIAITLGTTPTGAEELVELARSKFVAAMARGAEGEDTVHYVHPPDQDLEPGRVLGKRFRIEQRVGQGGMGAVFRASDLQTKREVAVKILLPAAAKDPGLRKRFEREAQILQKIEHPNFVRFVAYGEGASDPAYVVMEFLDGSALSQLLTDESRLVPERALHITRHVLTGLAHAHQLGIVHRDVKPDNVVIVHEPQDAEFAKILDFGIARLAAPEDADTVKLTNKGEIFGTPMYMSPEQVRGDAVDARADLYSVSVMLYEMLASRPPFVAKHQNGLFAMHLAAPPPPLRDWAPDVAELGPLQELLDAGLAKQPEQRIATASEYLSRVDSLIENGFGGASRDPAAVRPKPKPATEGSLDARAATTSPAAAPSGSSTLSRPNARLGGRGKWLLWAAILSLLAAGLTLWLLYGSMPA